MPRKEKTLDVGKAIVHCVGMAVPTFPQIRRFPAIAFLPEVPCVENDHIELDKRVSLRVSQVVYQP